MLFLVIVLGEHTIQFIPTGGEHWCIGEHWSIGEHNPQIAAGALLIIYEKEKLAAAHLCTHLSNVFC